MLPEDDPKDQYEHYQCDKCGGSIRQNCKDENLWECDNCDVRFQAKENK
ncbi:MAG: hypothetical protein E3K37_01435 [Candidatus Kuenenia sp.]|nr:hypothetical protein [Candidatus Kuenenia hertensis]